MRSRDGRGEKYIYIRSIMCHGSGGRLVGRLFGKFVGRLVGWCYRQTYIHTFLVFIIPCMLISFHFRFFTHIVRQLFSSSSSSSFFFRLSDRTTGVVDVVCFAILLIYKYNARAIYNYTKWIWKCVGCWSAAPERHVWHGPMTDRMTWPMTARRRDLWPMVITGRPVTVAT